MSRLRGHETAQGMLSIAFRKDGLICSLCQAFIICI